MKTRGFTLLELLVAITVLSVVSVIAWRGLDSLVATRERLEPDIDETRAMLVAFGQMERDLSQVANPAFLGLTTSPLNVRPADGAMMIEIARVAAPVPDRATEVQTVYYRVVDFTLVRQATPALPYFQRDEHRGVRERTAARKHPVDGRARLAAGHRLDSARRRRRRLRYPGRSRAARGATSPRRASKSS